MTNCTCAGARRPVLRAIAQGLLILTGGVTAAALGNIGAAHGSPAPATSPEPESSIVSAAASVGQTPPAGGERGPESRPSGGARGTGTPTTQPAADPAADPPAASPPRGEADPESARVVQRMMFALGGHEAWEQTRYITFRFFGGTRRHLWDKHEGRVRIDTAWGSPAAPYVIVLDLASGSGRVWRADEEVTDEKKKSELLEQGRRWFINDSYWLVMPYKLRDPGVRLRGFGHAVMQDGRAADLVEVTFDAVGITPDNKYWVYIARDTNLVGQWDFFRSRQDTTPAFSAPWRDWRKHGDILLSGDRGERSLTDIAVLDTVIDGVFDGPQVPESFAPPASPPAERSQP